jgi:DNA-binding NarL/FixJ family response regulator
VICQGPAVRPDTCRLLRNGACDLAAEADVIFNGFGLSEAQHREIIRELRATYPDTPVVVETTRLQAEANADLLDGCTRCDSALTSRVLIEAVRRAEAGEESENVLAE